MKKCLLFAFLTCFFSYSQEEHAWVYFSDKVNVEEAIANPLSILTQESLARKQLHNIPVDLRDVPVNENYLSILKQQEGISVRAKSKWLNCAHVLGNIQDIDALKNLDFVSGIEYANNNLNQRDQLLEEAIISKLESQTDFNYGPTENQIRMLGTDYLHKKNFTGEDMIIAVLDAGFPKAKDISALQRLRLLGGYDFPGRSSNFDDPDLSDHGTLVLSTMGGYLEDIFVGTAPDASYYLFRTEIDASETPVEESYWVEAAERADSLGVDIINSSLTYHFFDNPNYNYSSEELDGKTAFVSRGANIAMEKGILVVVSAGNTGDDDYPGVGAPADSNVLTVGAVDPDKVYAPFSSIGPAADRRIKPDVMAQGINVIAANEFEQLVAVDGTSFSSPLIAGSIAGLWQAIPSYTNLQIMDLVRSTSSQYNNPDNILGYGIPDFKKALDLVLGPQQSIDEFAISPNPVEDLLYIQNTNSDPYSLTIFDLSGQKIWLKQAEDYEIDLSGFSRGIYIAMFEQNNQKESVLIIKK